MFLVSINLSEYFHLTMDIILSSVEVVVNTVSILKYILPEVNLLTEPIIDNPKKEHHDIIEECGVVVNNVLRYILKEKHIYKRVLSNNNLENVNQVDYSTPEQITIVCCNFLNKIKVYHKRFKNELFAGIVKRGALCIAYIFIVKYSRKILPDYTIFNPFVLTSGFAGTTLLGIGVLSKQCIMLNQLKANVDTVSEVTSKIYNITDKVNNLHSYNYSVNKDINDMTNLTENIIYSMLDLENKILATV